MDLRKKNRNKLNAPEADITGSLRVRYMISNSFILGTKNSDCKESRDLQRTWKHETDGEDNIHYSLICRMRIWSCLFGVWKAYTYRRKRETRCPKTGEDFQVDLISQLIIGGPFLSGGPLAPR